MARPDGVYQLMADVARWEILYRHGGVYVDTDTTCLRPLDAAMRGRRMVLGWEIQDQWLGIGVIGSVPGHPAARRVIGELADLADGEAAASPGIGVNKLTGPKAISHLLRGRDDVSILREEAFYPTRWNDPLASERGHFPRSYTVHHWNHQRAIRGLPGPGSVPVC